MAADKAMIDEPEHETPGPRLGAAKGRFEVFTNTKINPPSPPEPVNQTQAAEYFEHSALAEELGEGPALEVLAQMLESIQSGVATTVLFKQNSPDGMSLVHAWFGPNFPLYGHSHPRFGDCLYYVVAGELILGNRRMGRGTGFFVPNGQAYKFTAGPVGVEVLEFRAGGGDPDGPMIKLNERSLMSIQDIIARANLQKDAWQAPENIGDTVFQEAASAGS